MIASRVSSTALLLSGAAGVLVPRSVAGALHVPLTDSRGTTEVRAGLGGTYAALGAYALVHDVPAARAAVGWTWCGAAAARLVSLVVDRPRTDAPFWTYLAVEVGCGAAALGAARAH